jgi:hypothetical protein
MINRLSNIIIIIYIIIFASCKDNLNSPTVNPDISVNKKILLEVFTSITCVNCIQANLFCDNISNLNGITSNDTNVLIINYHPSFFPIDPFFQFNKELNIERQQYYGLSFIPTGFSEGKTLPSAFSAPEWINTMNNDLTEEDPAVISIENILDTANRSGSVTLRIESRGSITDNALRLFLIITESSIFYNGPMGGKFYNNIARQMLNRTNGEPIEILPGQTTTLILGYEMKQGIVIQNSNIIAFIQEGESKKVVALEKLKLF